MKQRLLLVLPSCVMILTATSVASWTTSVRGTRGPSEYTRTRFMPPLFDSNNNNNNRIDAWDENVDYDQLWNDPKDMNAMPTSEWDDVTVQPRDAAKETELNFGIPVEELKDLLDAEAAAEITEEAKRILDSKVQEGLDELAKMRIGLKQDIESQKRLMERKSKARNEREEAKLMNKIDAIAGNFLSKSQDLRESTKLAAKADRAMEQRGSGVDLGSWGDLKGVEVTLNSNIKSNSGGDGETKNEMLLGSVENAKRQRQQGVSEESNNITPTENKIIVIADESSDPYAKQLVPAFAEALENVMGVSIEVIKPTQQMPLGGNNAACVLFFLTSLSSPPRAILERLLRRTMGPGGSVGRPPSQLVAISTIGTERTDKFPYSMQNLMGRKLENRREMEEFIITAVVKERNTVPPLDYTILKFGELKDSKEAFAFLPGDALDGTTSLELATQCLLQAVAFQPAARNATLCTTGSLPAGTSTTDGVVQDTLFWDDAFLKLKGPELTRFESLAIPENKFDQLVEYLKEWGKLLADSGKLTTPVDMEVSTKGPNAAFEGVSQHDGLILLFRSTGTGKNYLSKEEEREMEKRGLKPSTSPNKMASRRIGKAEGGVEILVEVTTQGSLRVRATRTNMGPETVIKELSENTILKRLGDSLNLFVRDFA